MLVSEEYRYEVTDAQSMAGVGTALLCLPLYTCVYGHVTPPSRQPRRAGISTVADMLQAAASVFGGKGNNSSVRAYLEVEP